MNPDQKTNIELSVSVLCESLFSAWSYYHLLRGLYEGGREHPEVLARFGWFFDQSWRAIFEGFFATTGTLLDRKKNTYSLPNLVTLVRKYGDDDLKQLLPKVEACLSEKNSPLAKIKSWRHEVVAHRKWGSDDTFHMNYKMHLNELESALVQLEATINYLSRYVLGIHNDTRSGSLRLLDMGRSLFATLAAGIANEPANGSSA